MAYGSLIESELIRDLTIRPVDLPLEHPVETASGVLRTAALVLPATPTAQWLEHLDHVAPILREPLVVDAGEAVVPDRPGAGVEWDEAALRRVIER